MLIGKLQEMNNLIETLKITDEQFEPIFSDIKDRYLSQTNFPKLIIGTGLSISLGVSGMQGLTCELEKKFNDEENKEFLPLWEEYKPTKEQGLEAALLNISPSQKSFVDKIREITADFILKSDYESREKILAESSGFEKMMNFLSKTVSVNAKIIDIMTPNYDLLIELISDKLKLETNLGFYGSLYQNFEPDRLKNPFKYITKKIPIVRIFKPHGSINWINNDGNVIQTNDYTYLKSKTDNIEIITPGSMKYQYGLTHELFRIHRETFNELISDNSTNFSIFIYGYGFNDRHFDTVFENTTKDVIVLTMDIKQEIVKKAEANHNWTLFYKRIIGEECKEECKQEISYMVYKGKKYSINQNLWDMDVFADTFLG